MATFKSLIYYLYIIVTTTGQNDMKTFRPKLIAILWDSELNTRKECLDSKKYGNETRSSGEIEILARPGKICKRNKSDVLYTANMQMCAEELRAMLRSYIKSVTDAKTLE